MTIQQVWKKNGYLLVFPGIFVILILLKEYIPLKYLIPIGVACLSCIFLLQRKKEVKLVQEEKNSHENAAELIKVLDDDKKERQKKKKEKRKEVRKTRDGSKSRGSASESDTAAKNKSSNHANSDADNDESGANAVEEEEEDSEEMLLDYASKQTNSRNFR